MAPDDNLRSAGMVVTVLRKARSRVINCSCAVTVSVKVQVLVPSPTDKKKEVWARYYKAFPCLPCVQSNGHCQVVIQRMQRRDATSAWHMMAPQVEDERKIEGWLGELRTRDS